MSQLRSIHYPSLLLGALLVVVGYGLANLSFHETAQAQTIATGRLSIFQSGNPCIISSSADGKTLHFWSMTINPEVVNPNVQPKYVGNVTAEAEAESE